MFFDLLFVAAIVHISTEVSYAFDVGDFLFIATVFPQFGLLVLSWLEQVLYRSRFRMTQSVDSFLHFLYMAFVLLMGLGIGTEQQLVLIMYSLTRCVMLLMLGKTSLIPRARAHSLYMMAEPVMTITSALMLEIFVNSTKWRSEDIGYVHVHDDEHNGGGRAVGADQQWLWLAVYGSLFGCSLVYMTMMVYLSCIRSLGINLPINVPHISERMGALVLIILGETIIRFEVKKTLLFYLLYLL